MSESAETVSVYVHVPFCRSKCRYCGFYSEPVAGHNVDFLVDALISEMDRYELGERVETAYIGGGSPSCLGDETLLRLVGEAARRCDTNEFTVEVNPGQVDEKILRRLRESGVNRLSIGAQSFNGGELDFLGRTHSVADIGTAVQRAMAAGFENISIDLIFAIGEATIESWKYSLQSAIDLGVQHISAYSLTFEKQTPLYAARQAGEIAIVDEETDRAMYETAIDELEGAGFEQYEISNFARAGIECIHNLRYWANDAFLGIGPGAASYYAGRRTMNIAHIKRYVEGIRAGRSVYAEVETPTAIEAACETAVLNLRRIRGIDIKEFKIRTGYDAMKLFGEEIERNRKLGLLETDGRHLFLTPKALPIADSVLCDFAAHPSGW
jgi:oxygen-independent coproporphyrinogen-3 oxidase